MADDKVTALLRDALGMDDVSDFMSALQALPKEELGGYLQAVLADEATATQIATLMGAAADPAAAVPAAARDASPKFYVKPDLEDDEPFAAGRGKKKGGSKHAPSSERGASSALVGGASVTRSKPSGKAGKEKKSISSLDSLQNALRPGRHPCSCNARRHALIANCLACGKVICEQEGVGPCLFCGSDPDEPTASEHAFPEGSAERAAAEERARVFKNRLLDFDRTSAKRTTVIDDQVDYYASAASDAWLSQAEKEQAARAMQAREDEKERRRKELTLTLDFESQTIVRTRQGDDELGGDTRDADGPCMAPTVGGSGEARTAAAHGAADSKGGGKGGGKGGNKGGGKGVGKGGSRDKLLASEMALRTCSADYVGGEESAEAEATGSGGGMRASDLDLVNPSLTERPLFVSAKAKASRPVDGPKGGEIAGDLHEQAMSQGLQYSVRRVQHDDDNVWLQQILGTAAQRGGGDDRDGDQLRKMAEESQERRRRADNASGRLAAPPTPAQSLNSAAVATTATDDDDDEDVSADGRQFCMSMHQPWASLLVAGIKRVEGRNWPTDHRGRLWIAATAREPTELEIATVEQQCMAHYSGVHAKTEADRYEQVMAMQEQVHSFPAFPTSYPQSALLGCVTVTECLSNAEYTAVHPTGEGNSSEFVFVCTNARTLTVPMRISGQHKIYALPQEIASAARSALRPKGATWDARPTGPPLTTSKASAGGTSRPPPGLSQGPPGLSAGPPGLSAGAAPFTPGGGGGKEAKFDLHGDAARGGDVPRAPAALGLRADRRKGLTVLQDGMVLLRGALDPHVQQAVIDLVREISLSEAGFYTPKTRGGSMHLQMMCLGKHWNPVNGRYEERRSNVDNMPTPALPPALWEIVKSAAETASEACASVPSISPGVCLVNHYTHSGRLGMHQDRSEQADTLRRGSPVVSISIGDACEFGYSDSRPEEVDAALAALGGGDKVKSVRLDSGDVLIFGGPSRMLFHGVNKIFPNHRPKGLVLAPGRLNLTFREL